MNKGNFLQFCYLLSLFFLGACNSAPKTTIDESPLKEPLHVDTPTLVSEEKLIVPCVLDTVLEFNVAQLTLKPTDSIYIEEYFLKNKQIDSVTKLYDNCEVTALAIEKLVSKRIPGFLRRENKPEKLFLKLKTEQWHLMTTDPNLDDAGHEFEHYFKEFGYYSIRTQCYEGNFYKIVNDSSGDVTKLFGRPYFSSNGNYMISVSEDLIAGYCRNGFQLFKNENGNLVMIGKFEPTLWGPQSVRWISENKFIMKCARLKNPNTFESLNFYTEVTIKE
ncbi:MAG: hypothetical protein K0S32_768 [Bacteroidetes bacterium]|jgi:hypothetical protein|nr:hypothetical protein [Bacteroidota bacterium]